MSNITLEQASSVVENVIGQARTLSLKPIAVAVLDAGGQLIAFKREDQSSLLRSDIAIGKAWAVLGVGMGGRTLVRRASAHPYFYGALVTMAGGKMIPGIGGVLIKGQNGEIIGAVGVSGDTADNDESCAVAGVEAAGLMADCGEA
jgi:uncharacterized protein GlcG (DUF336 family)